MYFQKNKTLIYELARAQHFWLCVPNDVFWAFVTILSDNIKISSFPDQLAYIQPPVSAVYLNAFDIDACGEWN